MSSTEHIDAVSRALQALQDNPEAQGALAQHKKEEDETLLGVLRKSSEVLKTKKGIDVSKLRKLGQGAQGTAFEIDRDRVLKVTRDTSEAMSSNALVGKDLKHITRIFDVWQFPSPGPGGKLSEFYGIVLERVIPFETWPEDNIKEMTGELLDVINLKLVLQRRHGNWDDTWKFIEQHHLGDFGVDRKALESVFLELKAASDELESFGVRNFFDFHTGNIGKKPKDNKIVIFDIGFSQNTSGGKPDVLLEEDLIRFRLFLNVLTF